MFVTSTKEVMFSSLFVCLLATLRKNFQTDLHESFGEGLQWANEQLIKLWWRSDQRLDTQIVSGFVSIGRYGKWYQPNALHDAAEHGMH